jgi:hypothetical protein
MRISIEFMKSQKRSSIEIHLEHGKFGDEHGEEPVDLREQR